MKATSPGPDDKPCQGCSGEYIPVDDWWPLEIYATREDYDRHLATAAREARLVTAFRPGLASLCYAAGPACCEDQAEWTVEAGAQALMRAGLDEASALRVIATELVKFHSEDVAALDQEPPPPWVPPGEHRSLGGA